MKLPAVVSKSALYQWAALPVPIHLMMWKDRASQVLDSDSTA